ncbi:MAG: transporter substrate-binding domain-containing protein [Rhodospirillales bacterium]
MPIVLAIGFAYSSPASSADNSNQNTIRFGMAAAEYPPYLIYKDESLRGIVGDTFFKISESMGFKINLTVLPRKRLQYKIKNGEIDAYATALEWVKYTSDHIWTDGIIRVLDNVIMVKDHRTSITSARKLAGKNIAVMSGYKYPSLDKMIKDGTVKAIQANRFESLLRMVEFLRVDYGILDKMSQTGRYKSKISYSKNRYTSPRRVSTRSNFGSSCSPNNGHPLFKNSIKPWPNLNQAMAGRNSWTSTANLPPGGNSELNAKLPPPHRTYPLQHCQITVC